MFSKIALRARVAVLALSLLPAAPAEARLVRSGSGWCGTTRERVKEDLQLHARNERVRRETALRMQAAGRVQAGARLPAAAARADNGDIAILDNTDGVIAVHDDFALWNDAVRFLPAVADASQYQVVRLNRSDYQPDKAAGGTRYDLGDDDSRQIDLPFAFPFFGRTYRQVYINSDGNLTFTAADNASSERSLGRVTSGPPRIAPLFMDLDPSQAPSPSGVYVYADSGSVFVSWVSVPEYSNSGSGTPKTFQVQLFKDGSIEFAYALNVNDAVSAVVGIAPGGLQGSTSIVSFINLPVPSDVYSAAILERFSASGNEIDFVMVAQQFYASHDDSYDYLIVFNNLGIPDSPSSIASERTLRNHRLGTGDVPIDVGRFFGSANRLQSLINMGTLAQYPADLNQVMPGRTASMDTPITVLAHEAGHLFLAYASVRDPLDPFARPMLGFQHSHWSFNFNSDASLVEGNRIQDNGAGSDPRFLTTAVTQGFSALDQYLMGLRPPPEVAPFQDLFYATGTGYANERHPQVGVGFNGTRNDVAMDALITAEGRRVPDYTVAPHRFRLAFVLLQQAGADPSSADITKLNDFRAKFETYFATATGGRAAAETTIRRALQMSTYPGAGVLQGGTAKATITLQQPAAADLTVYLSARNGVTNVPSSVVIPMGAASASFTIAGLTPGVEELVATPSDAAYETVVSHVQVASGTAGLRLVAQSGVGQVAVAGVPLADPVVLQAVDGNLLPYPGVKVNATVTGGGALDESAAVTDEFGRVAFRWTPGAGSVNQLTAVIDQAPASAITISALAQPAFPQNGVVSSASYGPDIAPGSLVSIFGTNLSGGLPADAAALPLPFELSGVRVLVNGKPAPVVAVRDLQVNFLLPSDVLPGTATIQVSTPAGPSAAVTVPVSAVAPGVFWDTASGFGAVLANGARDLTNIVPTIADDYVSIYATGLGPVHTWTADPRLSITDNPVTVHFGSQTATDVPYAGLAPNFAGLYQVNARVPPGTPSGTVAVWIEAAGKKSNEVKVNVR